MGTEVRSGTRDNGRLHDNVESTGGHVDGVTCRITPSMLSEHAPVSTTHKNNAFVSSEQHRDSGQTEDDSPWLRQTSADRWTPLHEPMNDIEISPVMTDTSL